MQILVALLVGGMAGWLGSFLYSGSGLGLIGNIMIGILGSILGHWMFHEAGIYMGPGLLSTIFTGAIGAIVILFILNLLVPSTR